MRHQNRFAIAFALILALSIQGCASSSATTKYRTIGAVKIAVDTGMHVWANRVVDGKTTPAQEAQVRAAFDTYKAAAIAYLDNAAGDSQAVAPDIASAATALLNLLATFGVKTGGK